MSNDQNLFAALKAAAWAIVAAFGHQRALDLIERLKAEIKNEQWERKP